MIYSVFDYGSRKYRYYEGGEARVPATGWFRAPVGGQVPEAIAARVPPGARFVGTGLDPRGLIATLDPKLGSSMAAGEPAGGGWSLYGLLGALLLGLWLGRRTRRQP